MRRALLLFCLAIAASTAALSIPAPNASASITRVRFGIGDQHPFMFSDPRWQAMGLKITRYNIPWDAAEEPDTLQRGIDFVNAANAAGVEVLLHLTGRMPDGVREALPTVGAYAKEVRKLVAVFRPLGVNTWGVWNEENHPSEPTFNRPDVAAKFFLEMHRYCVGCTIDALDILTSGNARSTNILSYRGYTKRFFTALGKKSSLVKVIGIHNYEQGTATNGTGITQDLVHYARKYSKTSRFWITESGGIAASKSRLCSEQRQKTGETKMFQTARALASQGLDRLYMYNWQASTCENNFDSGLIRPDGSARPALAVIEAGAATFSR